MCASIMDGRNFRIGAAAIVKNVKNPISLARKIMEEDEEVYLGSDGATRYAEEYGLEIMPDAYFITQHQVEELEKVRKKEGKRLSDIKNMHGTVGAVAVDKDGNIAAGTSTGGTENSKTHRIGDSSMIGVGTYANNETCGVSTTGDGEFLIKRVIAFDVSAAMEYKDMSVQEALHYIIHEKNHDTKGRMGVIAIDREANVGTEQNCERLHRGWKTYKEELTVKIER